MLIIIPHILTLYGVYSNKSAILPHLIVKVSLLKTESESEFGIRIQNPNPDAESGFRFRILNFEIWDFDY